MLYCQTKFLNGGLHMYFKTSTEKNKPLAPALKLWHLMINEEGAAIGLPAAIYFSSKENLSC